MCCCKVLVIPWTYISSNTLNTIVRSLVLIKHCLRWHFLNCTCSTFESLVVYHAMDLKLSCCAIVDNQSCKSVKTQIIHSSSKRRLDWFYRRQFLHDYNSMWHLFPDFRRMKYAGKYYPPGRTENKSNLYFSCTSGNVWDSFIFIVLDRNHVWQGYSWKSNICTGVNHPLQ